MIAIIDLGVGNYANVEKAVDGIVTNDPETIRKADKIILPGVGNFGAVVENLKPLTEVLLESIRRTKPFLGICLGMQLLFEASEEEEGAGLGVLGGKVVKFKKASPPHIGWNQVKPVQRCSILDGIENDSFFYFVHSYYVKPTDSDIIACLTEYNSSKNRIEFPSMIKKGNLFGMQFHPEKSGDKGVRVLRNFKQL